MHGLPVLPVNPIETAESVAHAIQGTTQVQICPTGPGFGLLAMILGYACIPFEGPINENILPKYKSGLLRAWPRSSHELRLLKIRIKDLATHLAPAVW